MLLSTKTAVSRASRYTVWPPFRRLTGSKSTASDEPSNDDKSLENKAKEKQATHKSTKTVADADAETMRRMAGLSGDGGEAGVEYEDGKPVAMKRGVKNNMFRYI